MSAKREKLQSIAEGDHAKVEATRLRVSFDFVDWDTSDLFFIHGLDLEHYKKIFNCFERLGQSTEAEITQQTHPSLEPKAIFRNSSGTRTSFPQNLIDKIKEKFRFDLAKNEDPDDHAKRIAGTAFEVRVQGKNYGRIHGFVWDKAFHVVWFDPAHNLYPRAGEKPKQHRDYATVASFSPSEVEALKEANRKLHDEHDALRREFDEFLEAFPNTQPAPAATSPAPIATASPSPGVPK